MVHVKESKKSYVIRSFISLYHPLIPNKKKWRDPKNEYKPLFNKTLKTNYLEI